VLPAGHGSEIRVLTVVDTFSHFPPVLDRGSTIEVDLVRTLERICAVVHYPSTIRIDQKSELRDMDSWAYAGGITQEARLKLETPVVKYCAKSHGDL
jgi:hypothetical protein